MSQNKEKATDDKASPATTVSHYKPQSLISHDSNFSVPIDVTEISDSF